MIRDHIPAQLLQAARRLRRFSRQRLPPIALPSPSGAVRGDALMLFIRSAFARSTYAHEHSNIQETRAIARALRNLGYRVHATGFDTAYPLELDRYDVLFGVGDVYENSFYQPFAGRRVHYATGANISFQSHAEVGRLRALKQRRGVDLIPRRIFDRISAASIGLSDGVICTGNAWTASTYRPFTERIYQVPVSYVSTWDPEQLTPTDQPPRNFLWFGGVGAVHKGLDLVLEAMDLMPSGTALHVCGRVDQELDFARAYEPYLRNRKDIAFHGFVDVRSDRMRDILSKCSFIVFPSCSEGGGSSVLTCMHAGLIPVVTREASVDVGDFGHLIADPSPQGVARAMNEVLAWSPHDLRARSSAAARHVRDHHALPRFEAAMHAALSSILGNDGAPR